MNHVVQYSGGAGSFATALWLQRRGIEPILLFADTQMEDEDLYRYLRDTQKYLRCPLITITDGRTPWEVFWDKKYLGNSRIDPCSRILKRELCQDYIHKNYPPKDTILYLGIDWTEAHRLKTVKGFWEPYKIEAPLIKEKRFDKNKFLAVCAGLGIAPPRMYAMGFPHNNCGGFCIKAGKAHFLNLLEKMPERYLEHEKKEEELSNYLQERHGKGGYTILTEQVKGETRYISLRVLRERAEEIRQTEDGQHDWGGCGCFSAVGEEG